VSFIDTVARNQAANVLKRFGKLVPYTSYAPGARDPATQTVPLVATVSSRYITVESVIKRDAGALDWKPGTVAEAADLRVTFCGRDYPEPILGSLLTIDGRDYRLLGFTPVYSGTQVATYICRVRE
jgi:hypothetical protein